MPNRFAKEVRAFVAEEKARGATCEAISANIPRVFPGVHISPAGVQRLGTRWRNTPDGQVEQARVNGAPRSIVKLPPKGTTCVYVSLVAGKSVVCGCEGYPYCENHRIKTAPIVGPRYVQANHIY